MLEKQGFGPVFFRLPVENNNLRKVRRISLQTVGFL